MIALLVPPPEIASVPTNGTGQVIMLALKIAGAIATVAAGFWLHRMFQSPLPLLLVAGSAFSTLLEPLCDAIVGIWYYKPGQQTIWSAFGNSFPVWTFLSFIVFYGGIALVLWYVVEGGVSRTRIVQVYWVSA